MRKHAQVQHAAPGTDVKHVFAHKIFAYPHFSEVRCVSTPGHSPPPYQPPNTTQPATLTATSHTVKTFGLLQPYFGHLSCVPVVYVTRYQLQKMLLI